MQQQLGDFKQLLERDLLALNPKILNEMRKHFDDDMANNLKQMTWFPRKDKTRVKDLQDLLY